jgi:hypothetical protein
MRTNTSKVIKAFEAGKSLKACSAIWTNGDAVWSYGTCLVARVPGGVALNATRYSVTTTNHQNGLRCGLSNIVAEVSDLRMSATDRDLQAAAREVLTLAV